MKPLFTAATTIVLALTATVLAKETNESLNLAAMIQPVGADGIYTEPGYATWDGHLFKENGKYPPQCRPAKYRWIKDRAR